MSRQTSGDTSSHGAEQEAGPGSVYRPFQIMDDLLDKLKLLSYEKEFSAELRMRPLNRHYFVIQTNPGEQFFLFSSLAGWLIRKIGKRFDPPQEFDDPNSTIANILDHVRQLGATIDFAPSKLKQGYGEQALFVLDTLVDHALKATKFVWNSPIPPREEEADDEEIDDDAEVDIDKVEEDMAGVYSEEEEGDILHIDDISNSNIPIPEKQIMGALKMGSDRPEGILESSTNAEEWRLEVERVAPQLKVSFEMLWKILTNSHDSDDCSN